MTEKRSGEPPKDDEQRPMLPEKEPDEANKQPEPGAGGLSKGEYDDAVEKATKDVHG